MKSCKTHSNHFNETTRDTLNVFIPANRSLDIMHTILKCKRKNEFSRIFMQNFIDQFDAAKPHVCTHA